MMYELVQVRFSKRSAVLKNESGEQHVHGGHAERTCVATVKDLLTSGVILLDDLPHTATSAVGNLGTLGREHLDHSPYTVQICSHRCGKLPLT